ncbi:uncharacterized protein V1518DRAFT_416787 [Limtongia smithiae]|uniref:uncharacterized protein n=1 Tax=Limtongia smithiae TaxID=1125753 RepID=UPI0034CD7FA8
MATATTAPVVFQCARCLHIVADSCAWLRAVPELQAFSVRDAPTPAIALDATLVSASNKSAHDLGASYVPFACAKCAAPLGKVYRATPPHLDDLRDCYTFALSAVVAYQLGSDEPAEELPESAFRDLPILHPAPDAIAKRLAVIETVVMALHDDLQALRAKFETSQSEVTKPSKRRKQ